MPDITFHGLRHTCATLLLSKGYDIRLIQEYLGHSSVVTTGNIYAHVQFSSKVAMGASLASIISKVWLLCDYFLSFLTNHLIKEKCRYFGKPEISANIEWCSRPGSNRYVFMGHGILRGEQGSLYEFIIFLLKPSNPHHLGRLRVFCQVFPNIPERKFFEKVLEKC